jgi:hypothetical protein
MRAMRLFIMSTTPRNLATSAGGGGGAVSVTAPASTVGTSTTGTTGRLLTIAKRSATAAKLTLE